MPCRRRRRQRQRQRRALLPLPPPPPPERRLERDSIELPGGKGGAASCSCIAATAAAAGSPQVGIKSLSARIVLFAHPSMDVLLAGSRDRLVVLRPLSWLPEALTLFIAATGRPSGLSPLCAGEPGIFRHAAGIPQRPDGV